MPLSEYLVTYKTDTNPHCQCDPRGFDAREMLVLTSSEGSAIAYAAKQLEAMGAKPHDMRATLYEEKL